jgi:GDP-L-fucose synthase
MYKVEKKSKIYIAGASGMVGSGLWSYLLDKGYKNLLNDSKNLDLVNQEDVRLFFEREMPDVVILLAGKVGGIQANSTKQAEFIYENLMIEANVIHTAYLFGVKKLIFISSSSVYPSNCDQPIPESQLLSGFLEKTNEPYSIAKIAGIKLCEYYYYTYGVDFYTMIPCNLYGPKDHFNDVSSHVIPALMYKFHLAKIEEKKSVQVWGSGKPKREFLFSNDLSRAIHTLLTSIEAKDIYNRSIPAINTGSGHEVSIEELALLMADIVGYNGSIVFDSTKPDGVKRKLLDNSVVNSLGWRSKTTIRDGLMETYKWFLENKYNK